MDLNGVDRHAFPLLLLLLIRELRRIGLLQGTSFEDGVRSAAELEGPPEVQKLLLQVAELADPGFWEMLSIVGKDPTT